MTTAELRGMNELGHRPGRPSPGDPNADPVSASLWQIRDANAGDLNGLVFLWLESFWHSHYGKEFRVDGGKSVYWEKHEPRVNRLLARSVTRVACDPAEPAVIWAFATTEGDDVIHYVMAKRRFHREEISADMFRDLLGERLNAACTYTHELVEFRREEVRKRGLEVPAQWTWDPYHLERRSAA